MEGRDKSKSGSYFYLHAGLKQLQSSPQLWASYQRGLGLCWDLKPHLQESSGAGILLPGTGTVWGWPELPKSKVAFPASQAYMQRTQLGRMSLLCPAAIKLLFTASIIPRQGPSQGILWQAHQGRKGQRTLFTSWGSLNAKAREKEDCFWHWE